MFKNLPTHLRLLLIFVTLMPCFLVSCDTTHRAIGVRTTDNGEIDIAFLQINDVYEISPLENGKVGGLARVATVRKQLKAENPNTVTILAGDFYSPSVLGTLKIDGKRLQGKQMVEVLNAMGLDLATFGNHEFDLKDLASMQSRIDESRFMYVSSNVQRLASDFTEPFVQHFSEHNTTKVPDYVIIEQQDADGTRIKIGVIGETIPFSKPGYVWYDDVEANYRRYYDAIKDKCDM